MADRTCKIISSNENQCVNNNNKKSYYKKFHNNISSAKIAKQTHLANADTGTTGHFIAIKDKKAIEDYRENPPGVGIEVEQPDGSKIKAIGTGLLKWKWLPEHLRQVHIFQDLTGSLLSIGLLCDAGFDVIFNKHNVKVKNAGTTIMSGKRIDKLWMVDLNASRNEGEGKDTDDLQTSEENGKTAQMIAHTTHAELVKYIHATMGAPTIPTLMTAVQRGYINPPGITVEMIRKNQPISVATAKGHLNMVKQGLRSTKEVNVEDEQDYFPQKCVFQEKHVVITPKIISIEELQSLHVDLAGRFPYKSKRGHQYIAVFFSEEVNYIHFELLTNRTTLEIIKAYKAAIEYFERHNINAKIMHMDGETSDELEKFITKKHIAIQFCPPSNHRALKAERAVQTAKNHFIASFCTTDPTYPMHEWDLLAPQIEMTLNLMRGSAINPTISAWHHVHGLFKWANTPLAPIGMKVLIHERSSDRKSWDPHGKDGFYIGPKLQHYRCYNILVTATGATRTSDTIAWFPKQCTMPGGSPTEILSEAINDLIKSINNVNQTAPDAANNKTIISVLTDSLTSALKQYREIFHAQKMENGKDGQSIQRVEETTEIEHTKDKKVPSTPVQAASTTTDNDNLEIVFQTVQQQVDKDTVNDEQRQNTQTDAIVMTKSDDESNSKRKRKSTRERRKSKIETKPPRITSTPKGGKLITKEANRPTRTSKPITFADGITMTRATAKVRGNRQVAMMAKEVNAFNHQVKAIKATIKENKSKAINFRMAMNSDEKEKWQQANDEEFERLHNTETIRVIDKSNIPQKRTIAYYNPQVKMKTTSDGQTTFRVRGTIGGDKIDYPGLVAANTADLKTIKLLINSTISTNGAKFMTLDIKDFYLGTVLPRKEYMRISAKQISEKYVQQHNLANMCIDGYYYIEISKGIYGLPQAGLLAQAKLITILDTHGYHMMPNTPCLFKHESKDIMFSLVVDDFGVKYTDKEDAQHLINTLTKEYALHIDWEAADYIGLTLEWDYDKRTVATSMPGCVKKAIERFGVKVGIGANSPMIYEPPKYGEKVQYAMDEEEIDKDPSITKRIQQIVGVFLYYARAVDYSILTAVTTISTRQAKITNTLLQAVERLLSYVNKYPNAKVIYKASKMELITHADASYLCETGARSRAGGIMWLGDKNNPTQVNGAITCISKVIDAVVASAGEAEYAGLFILAQEAEILRTTLQEMGHKQAATTIYCDNACAVGIANDTIKQKRSKAIDMRFHWVRDRVRVGHFTIKWIKGIDNLADFFTKALPVHEHQTLKKILVHSPDNTEKAQAMRIMRRGRYLMK